MRNISYRGKKVSVGIDVHAASYHATCVVSGEIVKSVTMKASPENLLKFLKRTFPGSEIESAYEAGFSGFELHRTLVAGGIKSIVVHAASVEVSSRDRVKTDKRDSRKIAIQLATGRLRGVRVPSREEEAARQLHRTREQLVRDRAALKAQIRMKFHQFGYCVAGSKEQLTFLKVEKGLREDLRPEVVSSVRALMAIWRALNVEIRNMEKLQKEQAENDKRDKVYRSLPGFGFQTARVLSTEMGDMSQFSNERKLFSFVGLTPSESSSGESERKGHITKQGSSRLRHILVEAAWVALRQDAELRRSFEKLAHRMGKKRAIVAIARKLLGRARALFRKEELYRSQRSLKRAA